MITAVVAAELVTVFESVEAEVVTVAAVVVVDMMSKLVVVCRVEVVELNDDAVALAVVVSSCVVGAGVLQR